MNTGNRRGDIGATLISSRSLDEYRAMFGLTEADLTRRILDCPGGAAGFTAEVNARGGDVTACDVAYFGRTTDALAALARAEAARGNRFVRDHRARYRWTFFAGPDEHARARLRAVELFAADVRRHPECYVASRLPELPFADASFDLVLSSHLLFSYSDRLDHTFHTAAIRELMRVARTEVRIFPLVAAGSSEPYPQLDELLAELRIHDIVGRLVGVDYDFQDGADRMLVCRRAETTR